MARLTDAERQARYRAKHPEKIKEYRAQNADLIKESNKQYREKNKWKITEAYLKYRTSEKYLRTRINSHLKRTYGITYVEYQELLDAQGGVCKICKTLKPRKSATDLTPLFVDHNHTTGKVRGLLCSKCNSGLGMFEDNIDYFVEAINYIKENQS